MLEINLENINQFVDEEKYLIFLMQVLGVILDNDGKLEVVYLLLEYNQELFN